MNVKKRIAIAGANPYNGNKGVGALAISTISILSEIAKEKNTDFELFLINSEFGDKQIDKFEIGGQKVLITNIDPINCYSIKGIIQIAISKKGMRSWKAYRKFDYIMNMGAGDSFADIYGVNRFNTVNNQNKLALLFRKKYMLLPQTIGPFANKKVKKKAITSINSASVVLPRDKQSFECVKNISQQENNFETIDVAFFLPFEKHSLSSKYIHVGLNVSSLLWHGGYTQNNQFQLKSDYQILIRSTIDYFLSLPNIKLHLIPHVVTEKEHIENDYDISYKLFNEYNSDKLILAPFFLTPIFAKSYIAGLDFFTGARMHSTIAAFSSGVAVFPMAYSRKFNGLFGDTLKYKYLGDMVNQDEDGVLNGLKDAFEEREKLTSIINTRNKTVVAERGLLIKKQFEKFLDLN